MNQKVLDLLLQREYDYRPNHMREFLHNLYSPDNVSYSTLNIPAIIPHMISLQMHPKQWNAMLSHSIMSGLYIGDINNQLPFVAPVANNEDAILYSQWYPYDTGLFSRTIEKRRWQLIDTGGFCEVLSVPGDFVHYDWNGIDVNQVALVESNVVKFIDLRVGGALSSLIPKSRNFCKLSRVVWHPKDDKGLFIGNCDGRIFYYDTRILTRAVAKTPTADRNFCATIMSMQFSPNTNQLITVSNEIIQWNLKLKQSSEKCIQNSNIRFEAKFTSSDPIFWLCNLMQPFITSRWIYLGTRNQIDWRDDIIAFDRKTGRIGRKLYSNYQFLSNLEDYTNLIVGVRRTQYEDDSDPQLIFIKNNCGIIRAKLLDVDKHSDTVYESPIRANTNRPIIDDRWSDDEV